MARDRKKIKKRSGCKLVQDVNHPKGFFMTAWNYENGVLWKCKIHLKKRKDSGRVEFTRSNPANGGKGHEWSPCVMVCDAPFHPTVFVNGLYDKTEGKAYFEDWNYIANPKASNGGYLGQRFKNNYDS
jgi:hypothetical protein